MPAGRHARIDMHPELLEILRCPFCGGRLDVVRTLFHRTDGDRVADAVIACECCVFPVVDGIPVLHLQPGAAAARERIEAGEPTQARDVLLGLETDAQRERFHAVADARDGTFREALEALGDQLEAQYLYHRFSDPTFVVADAVLRAVGAAALRQGGRAIDVCGGAGHLTRALLPLSAEPPVLADLYYPKIWLACRYTAPGVAPVCCDGNAPLPFARGAFALAACSDALMYVWMKRLLVSEMCRAVDGAASATVLITHAHNQLVWSPSHGQGLTAAGYRHLFEAGGAVAFGESTLFSQVVETAALDLSRGATDEALAGEAALTLVSSRVPGVCARHPLAAPTVPVGEWRVNPLYDTSSGEGRLTGRLRFPSADYESEYAASRAYLPENVEIELAALRALQQGDAGHGLDELIRRRVVLDLPTRYG